MLCKEEDILAIHMVIGVGEVGYMKPCERVEKHVPFFHQNPVRKIQENSVETLSSSGHHPFEIKNGLQTHPCFFPGNSIFILQGARCHLV